MLQKFSFITSIIITALAFVLSATAQNIGGENFSIKDTKATAISDFANYQSAVNVLGQPDFTTANFGTQADKLNLPNGVAVDQTTGKIYVADYYNNRVLRYASGAAAANGAAAEAVFGQPDFATVADGTSAGKMSQPVDVSVDAAGRLWVCDYGNNRVLRFDDAAAKPSGANADGVLGQADFTGYIGLVGANRMSSPNGIFADAFGRVWIADSVNNRVLRFDNAAAKSNGANADGVLGQAGFNSHVSGLAANKMYEPFGITGDASGRIYVADSENYRVLRFDNAAAKPNNANADAVLGQTNFTGNPPGLSASKMGYVTGVAADANGRLYVSDYTHNRVLIFNNAGNLPNGAAADNVLGQPDFTSYAANNGGLSASSMSGPRHLFFDELRQSLFYADGENNRVLRFPAALSPTAASVTVSGRVIAPQMLRLINARVILTDSQGNSRTVLTGRAGSFRFTDVAAGETYIISVLSKRYQYAPQVISVTEDLSELIFVPQS